MRVVSHTGKKPADPSDDIDPLNDNKEFGASLKFIQTKSHFITKPKLQKLDSQGMSSMTDLDLAGLGNMSTKRTIQPSDKETIKKGASLSVSMKPPFTAPKKSVEQPAQSSRKTEIPISVPVKKIEANVSLAQKKKHEIVKSAADKSQTTKTTSRKH